MPEFLKLLKHSTVRKNKIYALKKRDRKNLFNSFSLQCYFYLARDKLNHFYLIKNWKGFKRVKRNDFKNLNLKIQLCFSEL